MYTVSLNDDCTCVSPGIFFLGGGGGDFFLRTGLFLFSDVDLMI